MYWRQTLFCITLTTALHASEANAQPIPSDGRQSYNIYMRKLEKEVLLRQPSIEANAGHKLTLLSRLSMQQRRSDDGVVDQLAGRPELPLSIKALFPGSREVILEECKKANDELTGFESLELARKQEQMPTLKASDLRSPYNIERIWESSDTADVTALAKYRKLIEAYDSACLVDPSIAGQPLAPLSKVVGHLAHQNNTQLQRFCTAFRIKENRIVTARHCFFKPETNQPYFSADDFSANRIRFILSTQPDGQPVRGPSCEQPALAASPTCKAYTATSKLETLLFEHDWIVMDISDPGIPMPQEISVSATTPATGHLALVGLMLYGGFREPASDHANVDSWLRTARYGPCSLVKTEDGCLAYGCQAIEGSSGAPLISLKASGQMAIVGIHVAASDDPRAYSCPTRTLVSEGSMHGNLGLAIPVEINAY